MGDFTVKDTLTNDNVTQEQGAPQQLASQSQPDQQQGHLIVKDEVQGTQGTTATQQALPQTGINNYVPTIAFSGSAIFFLMAIAFKLGTLLGDRR